MTDDYTPTPEVFPSDTAEYVYRPVTKSVEGGTAEGVPVIESVMTQIWISQP